MKLLLALSVLMMVSFSFAKENTQIIDLAITEKGFVPSTITVKPRTNVELKVTRKTNSTCATQIQVPSKKILKDLPLNKTVSIELGKLKKGEITFGCGMDMMLGGVIFVK